MNNRAEMEIAINKRLIERIAFILAIIILAILYAAKGPSHDSTLLTNISTLQQQVETQAKTINKLQADILQKDAEITADKEKETKAAAVPVVVEETTKLSGKVVYDWKVEGKTMTAVEYNADEIADLQAELDDIIEQLKDDTITNAKEDALKATRDKDKDKLATLQFADAKYELSGITITVDNGLDVAKDLSYIVCWVTLDCLRVKAEGTISAPSGDLTEEEIPLDIPTLISLDRSQTLKLRILDDNDKEVFSDQYVVQAVRN